MSLLRAELILLNALLIPPDKALMLAVAPKAIRATTRAYSIRS
jgi:hypothetical protein